MSAHVRRASIIRPRERSAIKFRRLSADANSVILIAPIAATAWMTIMFLVLALCRISARADDPTGTPLAAAPTDRRVARTVTRASATMPTAARAEGLPVRAMSSPGLS